MSLAEPIRRTARVTVAAVLALAAGLAAAPSASADEVYPRPAGTTIEFLGHGWGHGIGMSQYGSLGGAQAGASYQQILAHYYTGTTLGSVGSPTIKVRVASLGSSVQALAATGLSVTWDLTTSSVLPTSRNGTTIARWRIVPGPKVVGTKTKFRLEYLPSGSSTWAYYGTPSLPTTGAFLNPTSGLVTTVRNGSQVVYRGQVRGILVGSAGAESLVPVVALPLESYLLSVVPSESPASWPAAALRSQAVAARSFAEYHRRYQPASTWYDVYDDTRSQVFSGTKVGGVSREFTTSSAAVKDTSGANRRPPNHTGRLSAFTSPGCGDGVLDEVPRWQLPWPHRHPRSARRRKNDSGSWACTAAVRAARRSHARLVSPTSRRRAFSDSARVGACAAVRSAGAVGSDRSGARRRGTPHERGRSRCAGAPGGRCPGGPASRRGGCGPRRAG